MRVLLSTFILFLSLTAFADKNTKKVDPSLRIDQLVVKNLNASELKPNRMTSDEVFVRRIHLDVIGRIPTKAETLTFLESKDPEKRSKLIGQLIGSDGYVSHQYNWWAELLRAKSAIAGNNQSTPAGMAYEQWLKKSIRENRPFDEVVYDLVTASGSSWDNPAIGYYLRDYGMPLDNLAITSQVFLGTQIVCAQCHDHPFDEWTQMDYYHLAAFTYPQVTTNAHPLQRKAIELLQKKKGKVSADRKKILGRAFSEILFPVRFNNVVETERKLRLPHDYQYDDSKPKAVVKPATFMGPEAVISDTQPPVEAFGEWLTSPDNPRFTKVIANRMWKKAFGVGLIDPVDDLKPNNPVANPELLDYLTKLMVEVDYDLQKFQQIIFNTKSYQRESSLKQPTPGVPYHFAGPVLRRMTAEQIWDSLVAMTVDNPDTPSKGRELFAQKKLATVQLIAEAIYDQTPGEFLRNGSEVAEIQKQLSEEIDSALAKVLEAREEGDPDKITEAQQETNVIRQKLYAQVAEKVYREELAKKAVLVASAGDGEEIDTLIDDDAAAVLEEASSMAGSMSMDSTTKGYGRTDGFIKDMIEAKFAGETAAIRADREAQEAKELVEWKVKKKDRNTFKTFNKIVKRRMLRASELSQPTAPGHFLREFGQSDRELVENSSDGASITQALALLNGPTLGAATNRFSVLFRSMRGETFTDRLDTIYLTMLSRKPTPEELRIFQRAWKSDPESGTVSGIVWTMLNTRQFLFVE